MKCFNYTITYFFKYKNHTQQNIVNFSTPYNNWRLGLDRLKTGHYIKVSKWINDLSGYYPHIKTLKRKIFKFKTHDAWHANKIISKLNPRNHTMVSIHVRLTDYMSHLKKLYHQKIYVPKNYFKNAMDYFVEKYKVIK